MATTEIESNGSNWHALHTRHQHEKTVAQVLTNKGFDTYLPLFTAERRWKDRTKHLELPLFPCYVFLRGGLNRKLNILTTPGVHGIVQGSGGTAGIIADSEILAIQRAVQNAPKIEPYPYLECGDRVILKAGPLAGLEGILIRRRDQVRLVLSIEMLSRSVAVEVDIANVEPLPKPKRMPETLRTSAVLSPYTATGAL
jgi:transcription antitermination factor NusG